VKAPVVFKAIVLLSGWAMAGWLFFSKPLEPVAPVSPKERGVPMLPRAVDEGGAATAPRKEAGNPPPTPSPVAPAAAVFRDWSAQAALAGALVGFCLLDEEGNVIVSSPLAETALCPASALKTVTTAAAFELLGPEFTFGTMLCSDGPMSSDGVLDGHLALVGGGDPTFSSRDLEAMADDLVKTGLKQVNGKLRVQGGSGGTAVNDHWCWGDIGNAYGAGAYELNIDGNRLAIHFQPGAQEGAPAALLNREGPTEDTRWVNHVLTEAPGSGDRVVVYSEPHGRTITVRGSVPLGEGRFTVNGSIPDPPARAGELLQARLEAAGVKFLGRDLPVRSEGLIFANHPSPPLPEIIDHLHKVSDNLEAQCLFLTMGIEKKRDPAEVVRRHWESRGVTFTGLRMIDGSGLARANMIRPLDLAKVNHLARRGPHGERFKQSLSSYLDGKVRSKLGAMSGVKTEVGFLTLDDGREYTFALMANGLDLAVDFWPLRERLLRGVASEPTRK
jgi:D-alanyl-D-alanine carboxypeptidase/D-alanyl-D-alanine-endopeptidase (penicillin-binding protein 4)